MGCIIACGIKLDLSSEVLSSLKSATKLSFKTITTIKDKLLAASSYALTLTPSEAEVALEGLVANSQEIVSQFTIRTGLKSECLVNAYHLMCGFYIYSKFNIETKATRILHAEIFNLFRSSTEKTLDHQSMKMLVKSVIIGVFLMTGQVIPSHKLIEHAGASVFYEVNRGHTVSFADFYKYLQLNLISLGLRGIQYLDTNPIDSQSNEARPKISIRKPTQFIERSATKLSSISSFTSLYSGAPLNKSKVFSDQGLDLPKSSSSSELPSVLTSPSNVAKIKEKIILDAYKRIERLNGKVSERGELYLDIIQYLIENDLASSVLKKMKYWSDAESSLELLLEVFRPYLFYIKQSPLTISIRSNVRKERIIPIRSSHKIKQSISSLNVKYTDINLEAEQESKSQLLARQILLKYNSSDGQQPGFCEYMKSFIPSIRELDVEMPRSKK